jgi:hypothetical protein
MLRIIIVSCVAVSVVLGTLQIAGASDICCVGKTEKDVKGVCVVKNFQEGRICMEEIADGKSKACWGLSGCYQLKDLGSAGKDSQVIVTGWRAGDQKCYDGPNCGKVIVVGGGTGQHQQEVVSLPPPPGSQQPSQDTASLPPPPGSQQPQQATQPAAQQQQSSQQPQAQQPQEAPTQTIDGALNLFKKAKDLFR